MNPTILLRSPITLMTLPARMATSFQPCSVDRLTLIQRARQSVLVDRTLAATPIDPCIERSWRRCLSLGHSPDDPVIFAAVTKAGMQRTLDANQALLKAATPIMAQMAHAMALTRYFAILTDAKGVVVNTSGPVDRSDVHANSIARVGVDLSEAAVGTTAIGAVLADQQPVWLHRGEHFFSDTSLYSCAGAPLFGPEGECIGMLDLTGVDVPERPELKHLVEQSARSIENALLVQRPYAVLLRLNWPGRDLHGAADGLLTLDSDGFVTGANAMARQLLPQGLPLHAAPLHCSDLFAMPWQMLFDAARHNSAPLEAPVWSGLRVQVLAQMPQAPCSPMGTGLVGADKTLRLAETEMIRHTVAQTRGNVAEAARILGVSRATVYRKLGHQHDHKG